MDNINFLAKDDFPMSTDVANLMKEMTLFTSKLALLGGNNYILQGCIEDIEGNVSSGIIVVDGELLPFEGGEKKGEIIIEITKKTLEAFDELYPEACIFRKVVFSDNGTHNWSEFKRVLSNGQLQTLIADIRGDAPGTVKMWAGEVAKIPSDYRLCDGKLLLKEEYPELFNNIGYTHGLEGVSGFRLPNLQSRFIVGYDNNNHSYNEIGKVGGLETVTLTENQIPEHDHTKSNDFNKLSARAGDIDTRATPGVVDEKEADKEYNVASMTPQMWNLATIQKVGKGESHENRPPFFVLAYIIKVK